MVNRHRVHNSDNEDMIKFTALLMTLDGYTIRDTDASEESDILATNEVALAHTTWI